jgi:hypothetical protein
MMMNTRFRAMMVAAALLAVAILLFRPMMLDATGAPFGSYHSADVELTQVDGSPHCSLLADCETISISNVGLDLGQAGIVLLLAGLVLALSMPRMSTVRSWTALVPNPPPLSA